MSSAVRHITLICLLTLAGLTSFAQQTQKMYLSGTGSDKTVNWQFYCSAGRNSGKWTTIPVPSNWELQGFGKYNYGWAKDTARGKEVGQYKYKFKVPASFKGKTVQIVFEGAMTDTEVKINGKLRRANAPGFVLCFQIRCYLADKIRWYQLVRSNCCQAFS
ncbi:sugar-binding domain-containing protein [Mucilaginibacter terrae]|uniref:beta-galactosidase n=1 Tax=Mucilaginibacter terrae TaxID=1955052 RepID=A0ABU3GXP9_9SPHI|nr:sugar-binding domain-containing protein [Mucilaginibacter terrae]MDT3404548.1 beta-galactosidase/beta-glucuronidase [Mucilaginibacter terrae]